MTRFQSGLCTTLIQRNEIESSHNFAALQQLQVASWRRALKPPAVHMTQLMLFTSSNLDLCHTSENYQINILVYLSHLFSD